jgi:hypothetical protein
VRISLIVKAAGVLLVLALVLWRTDSVEAADRYAMTCVENKTNLTLRYSTRWGGSGAWRSHVLGPARRTSHTYEYPKGKEGKSPDLHINFDDDLSSRMKRRQYVLESYRSPQKTDCVRYGREYHFRFDGSAKKFIDLVGIR